MASFRALDSSQINFLRSLFLSFSDRPDDQTHIHDFVRKQYRDIPSESRGALGQGVLELFRAEDKAAEEERLLAASAAERGVPYQKREKPTPKMTWKSFHRVCAALGLHLNERRGQQAIKKFASPPSDPASSIDGSPLASAIEPGMSFDDFMIFYANLSKPLSLSQEMREVFKTLDDDLDGLVEIGLLRQVMIGLEAIQPSNTPDKSNYFYESNYKHHYTPTEKTLSKEQLIDQLIQQHFGSRDLKEKINFQEFVEFLYA